jgi:ubiquinone biosynthesis protein UbiJ
LARLAHYVRLLVRARYRRGDIKAADAITDVSAELGLQRYRARALYYGHEDRYPRDIGEDEVAAVRRQATELLLREADELHRRADDLEAEIEQLKREHAEAPSWGSGPVSDCGGSK